MTQTTNYSEDQWVPTMAAKKNYPAVSPDLASLWHKPRRRPERVADTIKNEIALLLIRKIKDPRLSQVTITNVKATDDLRTARVYFSVYDESKAEEAATGFSKAAGFIRSHLARVLALRYVPQLIFQLDKSIAYQAELERIFHEIEAEDGPAD